MGSQVERLLAEQQQAAAASPPGLSAGAGADPDSSEVDKLLARTRANVPPGQGTPPASELAAVYAGNDPDRAARIIKARRATGLAHDVIGRNLDEIEKRQRAQPLDLDELARSSPAMASWLAEDPAHVAVARPDVEKMSYLERQVRHAAQQFTAGVGTVRLTRIGLAAMMGQATDEHRLEQASIERELGDQVDYGIGQGLRPSLFSHGPDGDAMYAAIKATVPGFGAVLSGAELAEQIPGATANQIPIMGMEFGTKALGAGVGAAGGALAGPGGAAAGATIGWKVGAIPSASIMEGATAFLDYEKLRDEQGRPLDRNLIRGAAIVTGAVNGALEAFSLEALAKTIPGIRSLGRKGMRELLAKQSTRQALEHALKAIGESAATEGSTEFLQEYVTDISGRLAQMVQSGRSMSVGEFLERTVGDPEFFAGAVESGKQGMLAALGGGAGSMVSVAAKALDVRRAERRAAVFQSLADGAQNSELLTRLPEAHQELVSRMTKNGPLETTYLPIERFTDYFQGVGLDPAEVASELTGSREAFDEAERTGGLLAIPTSVYATKLAGSAHHARLAEDLSFSPTELSMREAREQAKVLDEESAAREQLEAPARVAVESVIDNVAGQLRRAGFNEKTARTYAGALYGAPMRTLAARLGTDVTAEQLLARFNLSIQGPVSPAATRAQALEGAVERIRQAHVATRAAALEKVGQRIDADGEARFESPRTPQGARRPVDRVSTRGLLVELLDLEEKRADAEQRSVYELREDPNFHTEGIPQVVATREPGQSSRQAKALTNLEGYRRITEQVHGELAKRGLEGDAVQEAIEDLRAELDERAAIAGGWDSRAAARTDVTDAEGNVLFQPVPGPIDSPAFREWFGDSKIVDERGEPLVLYHQTTAAAETAIRREGFKVDRPVARASDEQVPDGIFLKPTPADIQLGGDAPAVQIPLYASIQNPLVMRDRAQLERRFGADPEYAELAAEVKRLDAEIVAVYDRAEAAIFGPEAPKRERQDPAYEQHFAAMEELFARGREQMNAAAALARQRINELLERDGYDGVIIEHDQGSFKRATRTIIALHPSQVKSATENRGTFDPRSPNILEQRAYHGSAHIFLNFSLEKIGTGEGAQVYGWGLYFAGKKAVADWYRSKLSPEGQVFAALTDEENAALPAWVRNAIAGSDRPRSAIASIREDFLARRREERAYERDPSASQPHLSASRIAGFDRLLAAFEKLEQGEDFTTKRPGRTYTVELSADDHEWLDWDLSLSEQGPHLVDQLGKYAREIVTAIAGHPDPLAALASIGYDMRRGVGGFSGLQLTWLRGFQYALAAQRSVEGALEQLERTDTFASDRPASLRARDELIARIRAAGWTAEQRDVARLDATGADVYHDLERDLGGQQQASEWLRQQGIPGIRYLNGMSRAAGEGDHNYVIFDDKLIEIREYEQAVEHAPEADPESTLFLDKLIGDHDLGLQIKLMPLLKGNEIAMAGTVRQLYDDLVLLVAAGGFAEQLGDLDPITSPAVRVGQALFRGASHRAAQRAAEQLHTRIERIEEGWMTARGAFLTRDEARAREDVRADPHAGVAQLLAQRGITEIRLGQIPVDMREYEQAAPAQRRELLVQHNITAANLLHAEDIGGLAMPSVAITNAEHAITGFGEITLLGDQALVDPRRAGNKLRVFGADAYSPRYPDVEHKLSAKAVVALDSELALFKAATGDELSLKYQLEDLEKLGPRQLEQSPTVLASFLARHGIPLPSFLGETDIYGNPMSRGQRYTHLMQEIRHQGLEHELELYARELYARLEPQGRIRIGWTAQGNARYIAHTLDNVIRLMRKELRGGETSSHLFGVGQIRAQYTPEFRTITAMREAAAAGKLVGREQFEQLRDEIDTEFVALANALAPFAGHQEPESFGWPDAIAGFLSDAARKGIAGAAREWSLDPLSDEAKSLVREFQAKLRDMPTQYFEGKYLRAVDASEFKVAVVPHTLPKAARELLAAKGLELVEYPMGNEPARKQAIADAARSHDLLFQQPADPRGRIRIGNNSIAIELLEKANLSTFIHETGHFYLEVLGTLAGEDTAPAQIRADYATILAHLGVDAGAPITREQHELFARTFEAYLLEGNAPTAELRTAFARFRIWLTNLYRSIRGLRGVELTPEVRRVFDRLFATDDEIAAAEQQQHTEALFSDPEAMGMSADQAATYREAHERAREAAREQLAAKAIAVVTRERAAWWKEERTQVRELVAASVYAEPLTRALTMLQRGTLPDGSPLPEGVPAVKLSRALLVDVYGKELVKQLPRGLYAKEGGVSADDAAALFGFATGGELLQALASSEKIPARIDRLTDERMRQEHGDLLKDGTVADEAMAAVHNADRARVLRLELEHLVSGDLAAAKGMLRKLGRRIPSSEDSRALAEQSIATRRIRDVRPIEFQRAEAKAAAAAIDAFTQGDVERAFAEKLRELHNYELYRAATAAKETADKIVEYMRSFDRGAVRARIGKAEGGFLEQIDALRERYQFSKLTGRELRNRLSLRAFAEKAAAAGTALDVPPAVLEDARRIHWSETTLEELEGVRDAVEQLAHLARTKNKLLASERARDLEDVRAELAAGAAEYFTLARDPVDVTRPQRGELVKSGKGWVASHTRMEFLFSRLDGFKPNGPFWTYFFQPFARAEDLENDMRRADATAMQGILAEYSGAERRAWFTRRFEVPAAATAKIRGTFTKANVLAIALNWGNAYNRDALMEGYGWSEAQVEKILATLDARDARFVQAIWNHIDTYWPAAEQLEREITGLTPAKVEAVPLTIAGVELRGGYYPIAFDREQSSRQMAFDLSAAVDEMSKSYGGRAMTRHGHLIERTSTGGRPLLLELSVINKHLGQVTHDLSHRRAVIDAMKLIKDPEITDTIERAVGPELYQQLGPWLASIAGDVPTNAVARLERIASRARGGVTAVNLGLNLTSSIVQTLGYANTAAELGPKYAALGMRDAYAKPWAIRDTWEFVTTRSPSMRDRLGNFDREVRDLARKPGALGTLGVDPSFMYQLIGWMDMGVSIPSWLGAYRKAMDGAQDGIDAGDERAAIDYADSVVRTTQAAGAAKDLAQVQRGAEWWKLNTAFYSSMSVLFNQFARIPQRYAIDKDATKAIASVVLIWFLPAVLEDVLRGRGPEPDDDKLEWAARKIAFYPLSTVVLLRDFASAMERTLETGRPSAGSNAYGQILESLVRTGKAAVDIAHGEDLTRAELREAFNTTGYFAGWPTRQLWKTGEFFHDWWTGTTSPASPLEAFWGAVTGTPKADRTR